MGSGGPGWLAARRAAALEALAGATLPEPGDEDWRYGRLDELDPGRFAPSPPARPVPDAPDALGRLQAVSAGLAQRLAGVLDDLGERAGLAVTLDGALVGLELGASALGVGARIDSLAAAESAPAALGRQLGSGPDAFVLLADALLADGLSVVVPPRARIEAPLVLVHALGPASQGRAVFPRTLVEVGPGAEATVIEVYVSLDDELLSVPVTEIDVASDARLVHAVAQELGERSWQLAYQAAGVGRAGVLRSFTAALGGAYARQWSRTVLAGEGAESELLAAYLGQGTQVQEFRTFQEHVAPHTRSDLVFKGAVAGAARSVYTGLVTMHRGARRADAAQTNRNLVLSESAEAYSVPNLDIQENDVRCSHASAVGPIDSEQLFYLESRGVPTAVAERLILLGFFEDLLARAPHAGIAAHVRSVVAERLVPGGREAALLARAGSGR